MTAARTYYVTTFDFFGAACRVFLPTRSDGAHFAYYFRDHAAAGDGGAGDGGGLDIVMESDRRDSAFVPALTEPATTKTIRVRRPGAPWTLYERFTAASRRPSLLPPFFEPPLDGRVAAFHAAAAVPPGGAGALLLAGASFSGKSALSLALLRRGWRLLSDDIAVLRCRDSVVEPFCRPVGIRANTLRLLPWLQELPAIREQRGRRFRFDWGEVIMVHADDLIAGARGGPAPLAGLCLLEVAAGAAPRLVPAGALEGWLRRLRYAGPAGASRPPLAAAGEARRLVYDLENGLEAAADLLDRRWRAAGGESPAPGADARPGPM